MKCALKHRSEGGFVLTKDRAAGCFQIEVMRDVEPTLRHYAQIGSSSMEQRNDRWICDHSGERGKILHAECVDDVAALIDRQLQQSQARYRRLTLLLSTRANLRKFCVNRDNLRAGQDRDGLL
jgi:hypothetical protein